MSESPNFFEIHVLHSNYFSFLIPVSAFGFDDTMIMEVCVEYQLTEDKTHFQANIWSHQKNSKSKHFIYPLSIPFCDDPETAIIEALNGDEHYNKVMCDFICETAKHRCDLDI